MQVAGHERTVVRHGVAPTLPRSIDTPEMTDTTTMNILQSRAIAIAVAAREQVLAAARLEIERLRTSIDTIEPDVAGGRAVRSGPCRHRVRRA